MKILAPLIIVLVLVGMAYFGVREAGLEQVFGVVLPYAAVALFVMGFIIRVFVWARSPVPFRIPTTCGQQKSFPWIKHSKIENPFCVFGVIGRMFLEIVFFRSLFRNTRIDLREGGKLAYTSTLWLWIAGMAFHYTFLFIVLRHLRFFTEPVPYFVNLMESVDAFFQVGVPVLYMTDILFLGAVTYLFLRRVVVPTLSYLSLPADYFPLFLIGGIGLSGVLMRYFYKVDIVKVKELMMSLVIFRPELPDGIGAIFYVHLFLISVLFAYFPFSKLMHMGGVFLSPTRNLANNNRAEHHVNPWNYPVKVHGYDAYEEEFRDKMKSVGLPLEKEE